MDVKRKARNTSVNIPVENEENNVCERRTLVVGGDVSVGS